jgi:hypothetical protein
MKGGTLLVAQLAVALGYKREWSWVRFPMLSLEFFIDNPSGHTMFLGSTQPLAEMSTRNIYTAVKTVGVCG